jgi:hypothetical protein
VAEKSFKTKTAWRRWGELRPGLCGLHSAPSTLSQTIGGFGRRLGRVQSGHFGGALSYADSGGGWILEGRAFHSDGLSPGLFSALSWLREIFPALGDGAFRVYAIAGGGDAMGLTRALEAAVAKKASDDPIY